MPLLPSMVGRTKLLTVDRDTPEKTHDPDVVKPSCVQEYQVGRKKNRIVSHGPSPGTGPGGTQPFTYSQTVASPPPPEKRHLRNLSSCRASLGECQSDCNNDCDCQPGLVCYHRDDDGPVGDYHYYGGLRDLTIPGCPSAPSGDYSNDYCINPAKFPSKTLWYVGSNGKPNVYPLAECRGDCDNDSDCAFGLKCYHTEGLNAVPGCSGKPVKNIDYCYRPAGPVVTYAPAPRPVPRPTPAPVNVKQLQDVGNDCDHYDCMACQGDCDSHDDCLGNFVCLQRDRHTTAYPVFGCSGTPYSTNTDYCIDPSDIPVTNPYLIYWGNDGSWPSSVYPFGRCQGDCDSDADCKAGYKCIGADGAGQIPGCTGYVQKHKNYCV